MSRNSEKKNSRNFVKKRLFYFIALLIPILFFVLFEAGLQIFEYGGDTALFVSTPEKNSKHYWINRNVARRYFSAQSTLPSPRKDLFLKEKPENCYRIFVLGGSTTAGFPYGNNLMFSRILHYRLSDTFPDRKIEVVNTAMTAINTFTQLDFMDDILEQHPDALLIYSGHNEFYGALGAASVESLGNVRGFIKMYLELQSLKTFLLLRDLIGKFRSWIGNIATPEKNIDPSATLMARIVKEQTIPLLSPVYRTGEQQFKQNLRDIFKKAGDHNIPVLISELISNISDHKPFVSVRHDSFPSAIDMYKKAQLLGNRGEYDQARITYYQAKDLDALRFRATEDFNSIIHSVAAEFNVPVIPMKTYFEQNSSNRLIGNELLHEHLHPNIDGYFIMADAFYNAMQQNKFISNIWNPRYIKPASFYRNDWGYTQLDSTYAALTIRQLKGGWPFKKNKGPNVALHKYNPMTKTDSVALNILLSGKSTLELGHIELAKYYTQKNQYERAFQEYEALMYTLPYEYLVYERAVKILFMMEEFDRALPILLKALEYKKTVSALKWIGQIYLRKKHFQNAIFYLEQAQKMLPRETQILYNLCYSYIKISDLNKANEKLRKLKQIDLKSPNIAELSILIEGTNTKLREISEYMKEAQQFLKKRELDPALEILKKSIQIHETSLANELIGEIFLTKRNEKDAVAFLTRARMMKEKDTPKLLYNLASAQLINQQIDEARETFLQLKRIYPEFSDPANLENIIQRQMKN